MIPANKDDKINEINELKKIFGEDFKFQKTVPREITEEVENLIRNRLGGCHQLEPYRKQLIDFLAGMLHPVPSQRKTFKELLAHPWLLRTKLSIYCDF